ncbi:hypothetical protein Ccrd_015101 [Cynara cardunculus var. scolymus]|uniref:Uncharacterized protein n=1 Tax=Cynara cardunculus var. scolymus TaxID=59895 RepID=A0A124SGJ1_CYNCS|nr:hypothetical protein Ccrd_015101 [Cynara cardunculus var. scolymus]
MFSYVAGISKGVAPKSRLAIHKISLWHLSCRERDFDAVSISIEGGDCTDHKESWGREVAEIHVGDRRW